MHSAALATVLPGSLVCGPVTRWDEKASLLNSNLDSLMTLWTAGFPEMSDSGTDSRFPICRILRWAVSRKVVPQSPRYLPLSELS